MQPEKRRRKAVVTAVLALVMLPLPVPASSAEVPITAQAAARSLDAQVELLRDPSGAWTYQDIRGPQAARFAPNPDTRINYGFTTDTYWYRITLRNVTPEDRAVSNWVLELDYPPLDEVDFYLTQAGRSLRMPAGDQRKPNTALLSHRNFALPLHIARDEQITLHLRVNTSGSHQVPLKLWTAKDFFRKTERENLAFGVFYGVLLVMTLYNLCIFFFVRDVAYLYYIGTLVAYAMLQLNLNGFAHLYLYDWSMGSPRGVNLGVPVWTSFTILFAYGFTRSFLQTRQQLPRFDKLNLGVMVLMGSCLVGAFFIPYARIVPPTAALGAAAAILFFANGIAALLAGVRIARFYVLAWSLLILGIVVKVSELFALIPASFFTTYIWQIGALVLVTLLSLALADRITIERKEKIRAQEEALNARGQAIENLARYERMVNNVLEGIFQTDREGCCINANPAMAKILGYASPEALINAQVNLRKETTIRESDRRRIVEGLQQDGQLSSYELELRRLDGSVFWGSLSVRTMVDANGRTIGNDGILTDIDARRGKERLERAREVAEAATATKSEFLAKMSHELRTPMNAIIGFTDLALRSELPERKQEHLKHIDTASHSLLAIINDILDLSKIEAGKLTLETREFSLQLILDKLADLFSGQAAAKGIELIIAGHDGVPETLLGDPLRLEQVLMNLVSNAIKFTEKGEVQIAVSNVLVQDGKAHLGFTVRDTGIGLTNEQQSRLFTPFSQADQSTTRHYGGTGLGLAICKQLVELMGGHIELESKPGMGSCFRFTAVLGVGKSRGKVSDSMIPAGKRILVVDDNASARHVYTRMLESMRFNVSTASSAQEALAVLKQASFDAVLMDWMMPQMDGIEATRLIRALQDCEELPVLLMTAHGREDLVEAAVAAGADNYLEKPVKPSLLLESLQQVLVGHAPSGKPDAQESVSQRQNGQLVGMRVLLVEDNALNRRLAQEILCDAGVLLDMAENGEEAVKAVQGKLYDVVLMDVQMPVMDGFEATRAIRLIPGLEALPIIAMTANAMERDRDECMAAGMNDFLSKPIDADQLLERMASVRDGGLAGDA